MEAGTLTLAGSTCTAHRWAIAPEDGGPVDHRHHPGGVAAAGAFLLVDAITEVSLASAGYGAPRLFMNQNISAMGMVVKIIMPRMTANKIFIVVRSFRSEGESPSSLWNVNDPGLFLKWEAR